MAVAGLSQVALVVSGIILARRLGPVNRGYLALLITVVPLMLTQLGELGLPLAATFYIARDHRQAQSAIRSVILPAALQAVLLSAIYLGFMTWFLAPRDLEALDAVRWTVWLVPAWIAHDYGLSILQGLHKYSAFNLLRIWPSVTNTAAAAVVWVLHTRLGPTCILLTAAMALASFATVAVAWRASSNIKSVGARSPLPLRSLLSFGLRAFLGSAYPLDTFRADQALVGAVLSPASLGVYVVASSFTNAPRFAAQNIGNISYPHIASIASKRDQGRSLWTYFWLVVLLSVLVTVPLEIFMGWLVPWLFGAAFAPAVPIARILLLGAVVVGARRMLSEGLKGSGNPTAGTVAEVVSWLGFIPLALVLMRTHGLEGVAVAFTVSGTMGFVSVLIAGIRSHHRTLPEYPPAGQ